VVPALKGGLGPECALKGAHRAEPGLQPTDHEDLLTEPLVIEVVETEETIQSILPDLDEMIGGGLITLERARVILYRPGEPE